MQILAIFMYMDQFEKFCTQRTSDKKILLLYWNFLLCLYVLWEDFAEWTFSEYKLIKTEGTNNEKWWIVLSDIVNIWVSVEGKLLHRSSMAPCKNFSSVIVYESAYKIPSKLEKKWGNKYSVWKKHQ